MRMITRLLLAPALMLAAGPSTAAEAGKLAISVTGNDGQPLPCRVHLTDPAGKPVQPPGLIFWKDHFVVPGQTTLDLPAGTYRFALERGPEYRSAEGTVDVPSGGSRDLEVQLDRVVDLRADGWFSGDLHVHRPPDDVPKLMDAEDLDFAGVVTWWNKENTWSDHPLPERPRRLTENGRAYDLMVGEDEREGGALLYLGLDRPLNIAAAASREVPSPLAYAAEALRVNRDVHLDAEKPFWWDFPTWAVFGQLGSVGLAHNHMQRSGVMADEAWGRARDQDAYPGPEGNGRWTLDIYDRLLETGLHLPPSAGSASGVLPNPVGYNRVYVEIPGADRIDPARWWQGLREGRSFVTNGPLLLCRADGDPPGRVFRAKEGTPLPIELLITLWSRDPIRSIEIVRDGQVVQSFGPGPSKGVPGPIERKATLLFDQSGWFLVRAYADVPGTFRFASTAAYYVEIGSEPRVSRSACEFFIRWIEDRMAKIEEAIADPADRESVLDFHRLALRAWEERIGLSTVD